MKKLIAIAVAVALVITLFAVVIPVSAKGPPLASERTVYETVLVPNLVNAIPDYYTSVTLEEGEVKVYADGSWEVKIKGLRVDGELFTESLDVLFWPSKSEWGPVTAQAFLEVVEGEGTATVAAGDDHAISAGEYPGIHVFITHGGVAWLVESGVIIE